MHKFSPHNAQRLEQTERYDFLQPLRTLRRLGIQSGMTVADVGAGTGFFSRAAAEIVGPSGKIFALDMSEEMLRHLKNNGVPPNMEVLLSGEYRLPLADQSVDAVVVAFVFHETPDRERFLEELLRVTRERGRIVIVEWKKQEEEHGPPAGERLGGEELERDLRDLEILERGDLNKSHYFMIVSSRRNGYASTPHP